MDVHGLVASQVVGGSFSSEVQILGNAGVEAPKRAAERINRNSPLDQGMSDAEILQDVIDQDFTKGGISRDESDRMAELRILLRDDSSNTLNGSSNLSNRAIVNQELARLLAAENGTVDPLNYRKDEAAAIAATLTQADARQLVRMREAMAQDLANRDGNVADYTKNYDLTPDQRRVLELTEATRLADLAEIIQRLEDAVADIDEQIVLNGTVQDLLAKVPLNVGIEQLIGEDILGQIQKNAQDREDPGANREVDAQNVMDTMHERNPEYTNYHAYDIATSADWDQLNNEILADQWEESQRENGNYLELRAFAEAEERVNNVEISLVLDISGSMGWNNKMANLRDAINTFIDAVINDSTQDLVSISVGPHAEHVSSGPAIMEELIVRQRHNYSHCVEFADADFNNTEISYRSTNSYDRYDQMQHFFWGSTNSNSRSNPACRYGTHDDIKAFSQDTWALKDKIARLLPVRSSVQLWSRCPNGSRQQLCRISTGLNECIRTGAKIMFKLNFKSLSRGRFARDENGAAHIEAMIMIPLMFTVMVASVSMLDLLRQHGAHQKAAFTIGDMVSRETLPLDPDYLIGTHHLLNTLTRTPQDSSVRISVVRYDSKNNAIKLDWSKSTGGLAPKQNSEVRDWTDRLSLMVHNERMIVVETAARWDAPLNMSLGTQVIDNSVFTRPRYAPQVLWTDEPAPQFEGS